MVATWIGHATVLIQTHGLNILTDPVWSDQAGPFGFGPRRVAAPGIAFDDLPRIDSSSSATIITIIWTWRPCAACGSATGRRSSPAWATTRVIAQAGVPATALDWGGRLGAATRCGGRRQPQPSLGRPLVHRSQSRALVELRRAPAERRQSLLRRRHRARATAAGRTRRRRSGRSGSRSFRSAPFASCRVRWRPAAISARSTRSRSFAAWARRARCRFIGARSG